MHLWEDVKINTYIPEIHIRLTISDIYCLNIITLTISKLWCSWDVPEEALVGDEKACDAKQTGTFLPGFICVYLEIQMVSVGIPNSIGLPDPH